MTWRLSTGTVLFFVVYIISSITAFPLAPMKDAPPSPTPEPPQQPFFQTLADSVAHCLIQSELKRDSGFDGASTGWTSWVEDSSALQLQRCMDAIGLSTDQDAHQQQWLRWMKACPSPITMELSTELRQAVNQTLRERDLERIDSNRARFLERIRCRIILLPSGTELPLTLKTAPGAMAYGKLLYGGVTRYRLIGSAGRRAGERSVVFDPMVHESWLQYGGPERSYQAIDMGPCALIEVTLTPKGLSLPLVSEEEEASMTMCNLGWDPMCMFEDVSKNDEATNGAAETSTAEHSQETIDVFAEADHLDALHSTFTTAVGGLQPQIESIVRRVLDGRVVRPADETRVDDAYKLRVEEARALAELGLKPVRGLLLHGPPGCGKTALAREISKCLNARPPKIVAAPELLDRWVGGSEKLVRELFAEAEAELAACNGDPTQSALHIVVIDEIDAVFRRRSVSEDSGEATRASAVNQLLSKLDGIHELGNVLVIGMTNRKELLDDALLRPGRLEVPVEIPLPDEAGRREILHIHFDSLRRRNRLSQPLCEAIDGTGRFYMYRSTGRQFWKRRRSLHYRRIQDLASDRWTAGFSGADLAGLVRCSASHALARARTDGGGVDNLLITLEDVRIALDEVRQ